MKLWLAIFLSAVIGISPANRKPTCRVVTGITVKIHAGEAVTQRHYSDQEHMTLLLDYLRGVTPAARPSVEAQAGPEKRYLILLHLSDGTKEPYYQTGLGQFGTDPEKLYPIDPAQGVNLPLILALLPVD